MVMTSNENKNLLKQRAGVGEGAEVGRGRTLKVKLTLLGNSRNKTGTAVCKLQK